MRQGGAYNVSTFVLAFYKLLILNKHSHVTSFSVPGKKRSQPGTDRNFNLHWEIDQIYVLFSSCCGNSFYYGADHGNDTASWVPQKPSTYLPDTTQIFGTPIPCLVLHGPTPRDEVVSATGTI